MIELLDCPFCGNRALLITDYATVRALLITDYATVVVCSNRDCYASLESGHEQLNNTEMAIKKWNSRVKTSSARDEEIRQAEREACAERLCLECNKKCGTNQCAYLAAILGKEAGK